MGFLLSCFEVDSYLGDQAGLKLNPPSLILPPECCIIELSNWRAFREETNI